MMMTNIQLWLSIAIPSILIVLSWINNNSRLDRIEKRLDAHDKKFDDVDRRFDAVIDAIHADTLEIMRAMTALHERVAVVEAKQRN